MTIDIIFEIIDKIPWETLKAQEGTCDHVPKTLKGIISENSELRDESYWKLDNHVVVQGGLFEGAFYIAPFLIALLNSKDVLKRNRIYDLLFEIGNGSSEIDNHVTFQPEFSDFIYYIPKCFGVTCPLQIACRNAVLIGIQTYVNEISNQLSEYRNNALDLLCLFGEHEYFITSTLSKLIEIEINSEFKEKMQLYMKEFNE